MAVGFSGDQNFDPIVGWELYQVTIDKYHVMFFFNNGRDLLNVANKFGYASSDARTNVVFEVYGGNKLMAVDDCLRMKIAAWRIVSPDELCLTFENGARLSIFDDPNICSWWFALRRWRPRAAVHII
jgi:hypothetical protein